VQAALQQHHFTGSFVMDITQQHGRMAGMCLFHLFETIRDQGTVRKKMSKHTVRAASLRVKTD